MTTLAHLRKEAYRAPNFLKSYQSLGQLFKVSKCSESSFVPKRVLILTKVSRYQVEKIINPNLQEDQLKQQMIVRGTNYDAVLAGHHRNKTTEKKTIETLEKLNIEYRIRDRCNIDVNSFMWADLILPVGGDGTFLLASNLIKDCKKPILGINSDPEFSEGFLMVSKKYTNNIQQVFERLKAGSFRYLMRSRIRVTLEGDNIWQLPFHMHEKNSPPNIKKFYEVHYEDTKPKGELPRVRRLPWLALNEVFIGESLSARISILNIDKGNNSFEKIKSSGMCVATGTGSTSWYKAINSLSPQMVKDILKFVELQKDLTEEEIEKICFNFNSSLQFGAEKPLLSYAIRDIIVKHTWPPPKTADSRGFCKKLIVKSQCSDAGLVIDGGIAVHFNMGTKATLETLKEDALCNIVFDD